MNKYELALVLSTKLDDEAKQAEFNKVTDLLARFGGTVEKVDDWGKRRLAYEINDRTEGIYVLANFKAEPDFPKELDRQYKITDGILRTIIIKKDEE